MSVREQCRLLGVPRGTLYYPSCGPKGEDVWVMRRIDEQYTATPSYGVERMKAALGRRGLRIGHNRVRRLLRLMGLETLYPKPRLSVPSRMEHRVYPYLLRGLRIDHPNQVCSSDITYIRLSQGFAYLVAISMDGRGRAFDNIFTERLWRSVKYEEVYLKDYEAVDDDRAGLADYFRFYNTARPHQALGYRTPAEVHFGTGGECNNVTGVDKKEKEAKRKKMLLLQNTTLKN